MSDDITRLVMDQLQTERKRDRRATYFKFSVIGLLGLAYVGAALVGMSRADDTPSQPYAALVRVSGEIMPGKEASAQAVNPLLERAFADKNAKGVVLLINSPGGTPVQSALIHDRIQELKKKHDKKVVAVGEDMMTSGAYMIAVAADEIVANRSTITGSIGVVSRGFGFTGLMDKLGVERRVMTAGEAKNLLDPFGPQTDQDKAKQAQLLEAIHNHFKDTVKAGRGDRLKDDTPGLFSGTVWTGDTAVNAGLVDKLGDAKSAAKDMFGADKLYEYATPKSLVENLMGGLGVKVAQELKPRVEGPMALPY